MSQASRWWRIYVGVVGLAIVIAMPASAWAHGLVGKRWFPSTLAVEDPFVADEMSLVVEHIKDPHALETEIEMELTKRLTPNLAIGIGGTRSIIRPRGGHGDEGEEHHEEATGTSHGWTNPEFMLRYQFIRDAMREVAATAAINVAPGGVGNRSIGRLSGTTVSPAIQLGKGFGDLPDWADWLKPVAVTTSVGFDLRTNRNPREDDAQHAFAWGATVMYSIPYLQSFVKDVGLPRPFKRLFPIVEFNGETAISGPNKGSHTAFANPGLIWAGKYLQLGVEAKIPLNNTSGDTVGILGMVHFFLDDLAPDIFTWTPLHGVLGPQTLPR